MKKPAKKKLLTTVQVQHRLCDLIALLNYEGSSNIEHTLKTMFVYSGTAIHAAGGADDLLATLHGLIHNTMETEMERLMYDKKAKRRTKK